MFKIAKELYIIPFYYFLLCRVLLLVSSLRKMFAGILSDKDILGSIHVIYFLWIPGVLSLAEAFSSVLILLSYCCKVLPERRACSDVC